MAPTSINSRRLWPRVLIIAGAIAMLLGTLDPLEGSVVILPGSGLIALGTFVGKSQRRVVRYWLWVFGLIAVGVAAMFVVSAFGGIGGKSGRSVWWGILILPYPVGWLMAVVGAVLALIRFIKARGQRSHA
jgi:purine-cytosine permease-like protein